MYDAANGGRNRGHNYNHSTFVDLILRLLGLRPRSDRTLSVRPLLPANADAPSYFAVDGLRIHGRDVAVVYDRDGARYGLGAGLQVLVDGHVAATGEISAGVAVQL